MYITCCVSVTTTRVLSVMDVSEARAQSCVPGVLGATHVEIEHHLEMGRKLLAAGQLAEALSHYHSAVGKVTHRHVYTHLLADVSHQTYCSYFNKVSSIFFFSLQRATPRIT